MIAPRSIESPPRILDMDDAKAKAFDDSLGPIEHIGANADDLAHMIGMAWEAKDPAVGLEWVAKAEAEVAEMRAKCDRASAGIRALKRIIADADAPVAG